MAQLPLVLVFLAPKSIAGIPSYGCFLKWWVSPPFTPQVMIIFSRKMPWLLGISPPFRVHPHMYLCLKSNPHLFKGSSHHHRCLEEDAQDFASAFDGEPLRVNDVQRSGKLQKTPRKKQFFAIPWQRQAMKGISLLYPVGKGCLGCVSVRCVETTSERLYESYTPEV